VLPQASNLKYWLANAEFVATTAAVAEAVVDLL
jgi:hypothetical protein